MAICLAGRVLPHLPAEADALCLRALLRDKEFAVLARRIVVTLYSKDKSLSFRTGFTSLAALWSLLRSVFWSLNLAGAFTVSDVVNFVLATPAAVEDILPVIGDRLQQGGLCTGVDGPASEEAAQGGGDE